MKVIKIKLSHLAFRSLRLSSHAPYTPLYKDCVLIVKYAMRGTAGV
jgi:hypothetical protein